MRTIEKNITGNYVRAVRGTSETAVAGASLSRALLNGAVMSGVCSWDSTLGFECKPGGACAYHLSVTNLNGRKLSCSVAAGGSAHPRQLQVSG